MTLNGPRKPYLYWRFSKADDRLEFPDGSGLECCIFRGELSRAIFSSFNIHLLPTSVSDLTSFQLLGNSFRRQWQTTSFYPFKNYECHHVALKTCKIFLLCCNIFNKYRCQKIFRKGIWFMTFFFFFFTIKVHGIISRLEHDIGDNLDLCCQSMDTYVCLRINNLTFRVWDES